MTTNNPPTTINSTVYTGSLGHTTLGATLGPAYTISNNRAWDNAAVAIEANGSMSLTGENADIIINGASLTQTLKHIENRLNILRPNLELEAEWDELQELGQQYRRLEAELMEKQRMWEILSKDNG